MTHDPQRMDSQEAARVEELRRRAKSRPHLNAQEQISDDPHAAKKQRRRTHGFTFSEKLGFRNAVALGDSIRRSIERREEFKAMQGTPVIHVKNGKPLTEYGAQLLGVQWKNPDDTSADRQ